MRAVRFLSLLVLVCIMNGGVAHPYAFITSSGGNYLRWSAEDIPIDYIISTWWLPNAIEPVGAVYAGYQPWEDVLTASVSFNYQGTTTDTLPAGQDNVNMIGWNADVYLGGSETPGALAATYIAWYDTTTLYFDEVDIAFDVGEMWTTIGAANKYDIQAVVTHEVGHLLGLAHSSVTAATMIDGTVFYNVAHAIGDGILLRTVHVDDINGLTILYPLDYVSTGVAGTSGGCFIATALYGSSLAGEVEVLSDFRDRYLVSSESGRKFVELYYRVSPPAARFIERHPALRKLLRVQMTPFVRVVAGLMNQTSTN